jgi:hypothetical protein
VRFTATGAKKVTWSAIGGMIDADGNFDAPYATQSITATLIATGKDDPKLSATATVNVVAPGQVTGTGIPQVALYTISLAAAAQVSVQFGLDTNYGLRTWTQPMLQGGGTAELFVAGMKANTLYHMRGGGAIQCRDAIFRNLPKLIFERWVDTRPG